MTLLLLGIATLVLIAVLGAVLIRHLDAERNWKREKQVTDMERKRKWD